MPHSKNTNYVRSYQVRNAIVKFFKRPPVTVIIFLEIYLEGTFQVEQAADPLAALFLQPPSWRFGANLC